MVSELKALGQLLTVFVLLCIYCAGWICTIAYLCYKNDDDFCGVITTIWIVGHAVGLIWFLVWSWS